MRDTLSRNWWMLVLRGVLAIIFGLAALIFTGAVLAVLVFLFGAYALIDGIGNVYTAFTDRARNERWWLILLEGIAGIAAGVVTFLWPDITALILLYLIAAWAIVTGVLEVITAIHLRREIDNELFLGLSGVLSIIFGVVLVLFPGEGALAVVWVIGLYALFFGALLIALGIRLRSGAESVTAPGV